MNIFENQNYCATPGGEIEVWYRVETDDSFGIDAIELETIAINGTDTDDHTARVLWDGWLRREVETEARDTDWRDVRATARWDAQMEASER